MPRTALIVGNGLTMGLLSRADPAFRNDWPPTHPLSWDVHIEDGRSAQECLPGFFAEAEEVSDEIRGGGDFAIIDSIVKLAREREAAASGIPGRAGAEASSAAAILGAEVRHFLGLAYSAFDAAMRERCSMDDWPWLGYLKDLREDLIAVVSFNYDTLIERALTGADIRYYCCGVEQGDGIPLGKPHGSIEYELQPLGGLAVAQRYPITHSVGDLVNVPMRRLPTQELLSPRGHAAVVPPMSASQIRTHQWVAPVFDALAALAPNVERCVLIGLSGWPVDRPELCEMVRSFNRTTEFVIANPSRDAQVTLTDLVCTLGRRPPTVWPDGLPR